MTDEEILAVRDSVLPAQGQELDCVLFARAILAAARGEPDLPPQWLDNLRDAARYLFQEGQTKQGIAVQACITMLEDDSED